ncbi:MAG: ribonuclease Z, partial [Odoribacter sp.]|nr:ribonuclease Z [Odoribacter sp.]
FRESFADYVRGVDLLYHEATYGKADEALLKDNGHSTAEQAARLARLAGAKKLLLGHFSARYTDPAVLLPEAQSVFPDTFICSDGDVFDIPVQKRNCF